ncbi:hypothetical protein HAPAU_32420 [Halalkalicoccus paucihalophilus]|uniref:Uncharacterized protein n=1 Tax=Halalkalicoccus paucihalophilus TaxID=1008153 RepID=A0A151AB52_9EURY|nr:hypothetical protein HAPAU_32420 [Halalkalicoccus paucihalophilus]
MGGISKQSKGSVYVVTPYNRLLTAGFLYILYEYSELFFYFLYSFFK